MKSRSFKGIFRQVIVILMILAVTAACKTSQVAVDSKDLSYLYNPTKNPISPRYDVTNTSDNQSILSVKFFSSELFFSEANPQGVPTAQLLITVKLFSTGQGRALADTAFLSANVVKKEGSPEYVYNIPLKVTPEQEYLAEVRILDRIRLQVVQAFVNFNTLSVNNSYNFLARGNFEKNALFNPVLKVNEYVNLIYLRGRIDSLFVAYYKPFREVPYPPSMLLPDRTIDYGPDTIVPLPYSDTLPMMFPREGIYHCTTGRKIPEGFTFFNFGESFPRMNSALAMIEPLAYIANEDELNTMRTAPKPKVALDEFWIKCGGNVEKSRELIRIYYTRVQFANYYFTSYKEGWRTDRGMIYLIYGPPDKVYKTTEGENWGYRKPVIKSSWGTRYRVKEEYLFFTFRKKENIFSDNDFYLSRSETLVTFWDQAVAAWRKGIVFRLDNPEEI